MSNKPRNYGLTKQASLSSEPQYRKPMPYLDAPYFPCYIVPSKHQCSDCEKTSPYLNDSYSRSLSKSKEYSSSLVDLNQIPTFYKTSYKESYNKNAFDTTMMRPMTSYGY